MKLFKKILKRIFLLFIFSSIFLWCYYSIYLIEESSAPDDVKKAIHNFSSIDFDKSISGNWDNIVIITPYMSEEYIQKNFNINFNRILNKKIKYGEGQVLFVFCIGNSVESYFYIQTYSEGIELDYTKLPKPHRILREKSVFLSNKEIIEGRTFSILSYNPT